ncbi:SAM-dependent methyltransferase [Rhodospirillum centenum]|uniref:Methyltransferase domain-containing protein n=1 Tax=Rhodospirillum centenum (strain ATCC 51521 / SW) TaxID=414684 RepID=B6IP42_RHOCS|nr:methyltransferase domain-containing protein [Rhodospirillum centenum]ACI99544.1 conserved hypothetical protein [Rhodospirillum centenum SW]
MAGTQNEGDGATLTFRQRFIAWWEGYDLSGLRRGGRDGGADGGAGGAGGGSAAAAGGAGRSRNRYGKPLWTATRVQVAEKIWGEGFSTPGGLEHISTLIKPLGLNPAMSVLDIGAGLGGSTRTMAQQCGAWVTGLEHDPVLAEKAKQLSQKAGLAKQAPVEFFDPENFVWTKRVDAIFSKETFFTIQNKDALIDTMELALKPRGQFLFTDYVQDRVTPRGRDYEAWMKHEPVEPHPWTVDQYVGAMQQRNLDIRITEDISDMHRGLVLTAIQDLVRHLETVSMDHDTKLAVVDEVEMWARRLAALAGGLRCYRFYAMKPADLS